ncbi:hypothetical protein PF007_g26177 [Phytophthora fragariae]|uniref:RxLR effector protein n=1 Tax=Phytophthora fragariae TaxID=53985 RepID=A0A6A3QB86_9STRA|nr:hypothetical protein PF007_g26177 [Phytophthora fragariae]KAE9277102.1 hypothetical protein PF001_g25822 [Phytophthora fragariae]
MGAGARFLTTLFFIMAAAGGRWMKSDRASEVMAGGWRA